MSANITSSAGAAYDPARPLTHAQIMADPALHQALISLTQKRYMASTDYMQPWFEKWTRFHKIYRSIVDTVENSDEPNTAIAYAYGIIEDLVSTISEPILQSQPPCRVQAKRFGQEPQAENFATICRNYFQTSRYQLEFTESIRELCIIGNSWEKDVWLNEYAPGKLWQQVTRTTIMDGVRGLAGKVFGGPVAVPYKSTEEVDHSYPLRVGYATQFPWAFNIFPEPGIKNVRDMHWLLEQERSVAIDDLIKKTYTDPATKKQVSFFNFELMLKAVGKHEPGAIKPVPMEMKKDYGKEVQDALAGRETEKNQWQNSDIDLVHLLWVTEPNRVYAVANGQYIVAYKENVFQTPRINYRLKVYTGQKEFLMGTGAIEPIESQLYELQDIHKLSMRNWVRSVNKMVAYDEGKVPFKEDFLPRAGGKVRVRPGIGQGVASAFHSIEVTDVTQSMLAQESNSKGLIERCISVADYSPGVDGTKQTHKTLGGLMEISKNVAKRTTTIRRMILSSYQDQMWFMEKLYSQFLMDKQPFTIYGPDGSTRLSSFDLWDIHTDGAGFDYIIEYDPSFGDDALLRNQMMVLLDTTLKYENARVQMGDASMAKANIEDVMRRIFRAFGWADTSNMLIQKDGMLDPQAEFNIMLDGQPVQPNPGEDLAKHLIEHYIQLRSPKLQQGILDGSIDPKVLMLLKQHIAETEQDLGQILKNAKTIAAQQVAQNIAGSSMGQRSPMPGAAGGNPNANTPSPVGGQAVAGVPVLGPTMATPRNSGMPEGV